MVSSTTLAGVIMIIIIIITGANATITPEDLEYEITEGGGMASICLNVTADSNTNEPFEITVDTSAVYTMGVTAMGSGTWNIVCCQFSIIAKTSLYSFCLM